jgi:hypothetical protein
MGKQRKSKTPARRKRAPASPFAVGATVFRGTLRDQPLEVTGVDEEHGAWVCCKRQTGPGQWHYETFRPDELNPA